MQINNEGNSRSTEYTSKTLTLVVLAILFFLLGALFVNLIIFLSIPLVILLSVMILQSRRPGTRIEIARICERIQFNEHETCKVKLRIKNLGDDIPILQIRDLVPRLLEGENTQNGFTLGLRSGESKDLYYEIYGNVFGIYTIGPVNVLMSDISGLFRFESVLKLRSSVIVLPEIKERLDKFTIRPRKTKPWPGEIASRRTGQGMNYYSVRPMISGEPLKRINWKATARSNDPDQLFANEFMAELGAEALIVVDGRRESEIGKRPDSTVSYSIRAALAIADRLLRDRNRVGLLTIGEKGTRIVAGYGRRQYDRLTLALMNLVPGQSNLEGISHNLRLLYPNVSQIVFVSSLIDKASFSSAAEISRAGYDLIVISPNPIYFGSGKTERTRSREHDIAMNLAQLERNANIEQLRSANTLVVDWNKAQPLQEVIEASDSMLAQRLIHPRR